MLVYILVLNINISIYTCYNKNKFIYIYFLEVELEVENEGVELRAFSTAVHTPANTLGGVSVSDLTRSCFAKASRLSVLSLNSLSPACIVSF